MARGRAAPKPGAPKPTPAAPTPGAPKPGAPTPGAPKTRPDATTLIGGAAGLGGVAGLITMSTLNTARDISVAALGTKALEDVLDFLKDPTTLAIVGGVVVLFLFKR